MSNELLRLQDQLKAEEWEEYKKKMNSPNEKAGSGGLAGLFSAKVGGDIQLKMKFEIERKYEQQRESLTLKK